LLRFARTLYTTLYGITENLPGLAALEQYGRVYFNLPYIKDLVNRVEARELLSEEALEDGRKSSKSPAGQGQQCS
jgi:hypothetical protein